MPNNVTCTSISFCESEDFLFDHALSMGPHDFPLHNHHICELLFLKSGDATYRVDGRVYKLSPGSLIISRPWEWHSIHCNAAEYDRYNILFSVDLLDSHIWEQIPSDVSVVHFDGNSLVLDLLKKTDYYCEHFEGENLRAILKHLVEEVLYNVVLAVQNQMVTRVYTVNPTINKALSYINGNLSQPFTIEALCEELFITKSHLHRLFSQHLGISPKQYILSQKLLLAQRELRTGQKPTDVSLHCGFSDYSTFYRDYKKHFGHGPSEEASLKLTHAIQS